MDVSAVRWEEPKYFTSGGVWNPLF